MTDRYPRDASGLLALPHTDTIIADLRAVDSALSEANRQVERARHKLALHIGAAIATARSHDAGGQS